MKIPEHARRTLPFVKNGRDINAYYFSKHPDIFGGITVKEDSESIRKRVESQTLMLQQNISSDASMKVFRKSLKLSHGQMPAPEAVQILCLVIYDGQFSTHHDKSLEIVACRIGAMLCDDSIQGKLTAKCIIADYLDMGVLAVSKDSVSLCKSIMDWFTVGNSLLLSNLDGELTQHILQQRRQEKQSTSTKNVENFVKNIPFLTPLEMDALIIQAGYMGQEAARRMVCLSAYRHIQRLRRIFVDKVNPKTIPKRENILCIGPTGCGKTYLMTLLFENVLKIPTVIVDITKFSETGYVGEETESILTRLFLKANKNLEIAECGIVAIDEIDKVASSLGGRNRFGGEGSTKDVSGYGVQRSLLKMLEGFAVDTPVVLGDLRCPKISFNTRNVLFVGCGAFSGLEFIANKRKSIGFNACADGETDSQNEDIENRLYTYGLVPELVGRFEQVAVLSDLSRQQLKSILEVNVSEEYRKELSLEGIGLQISPSVYDLLVDKAVTRRTGARGLTSGLISILTDALFLAYSTTGRGRVIRVFVNNGEAKWDIHSGSSQGRIRSGKKSAKVNTEEIQQASSIGGL